MAIKIECNEKKEPEFEYPFIGYNDTGSGLKILFISEGKGTVIDPGHSGNNIGYYCESWHMGTIRKYNRKITLSND